LEYFDHCLCHCRHYSCSFQNREVQAGERVYDQLQVVWLVVPALEALSGLLHHSHSLLVHLAAVEVAWDGKRLEEVVGVSLLVSRR
jgi:hypothetical protein